MTDFEVNVLSFVEWSCISSVPHIWVVDNCRLGAELHIKKNDEGAVLVPLRVLNLKRFTLRAFIVPVMSLSQKDL